MPTVLRKTPRVLTLALVSAGCGSTAATGTGDTESTTAGTTASGPASTDSGPTDDASSGTSNDGGSPTGEGGSGSETGGDPACSPSAICLDAVTVRHADCEGIRDEPCASGAGCLQGSCVVAQCSDECRIGDVDGARTCEAYDLASQSWASTDPNASMADRSHAYRRWLGDHGLVHGGVHDIVWDDPPAYTQKNRARQSWDSAIWTGTYLAAEALRLKATGSADARAMAAHLVDTLHLWFHVAGSPGVLSRFAVPAGVREPELENMDCAARGIHCDVDYQGTAYDYMGHISRDQYQGVMLGYSLAYDALGPSDEDTRAIIREDVKIFVDELLTERQVPVRLSLGGQDIDLTLDGRFMVIADRELVDGRVELGIDFQNLDNSDMWGFQEFYPDVGDFLGQIPGLGLFQNVPRADSAIMLASFLQVAMQVTRDVPGQESDYERYRSYYYENSGPGGNVNDWIPIASQWAYTGQCGNAYYANNIVMEPFFNLIRLEEDEAIRDRWLSEVLDARLWPELGGTKNVFFDWIEATAHPRPTDDDLRASAGQLAGFPPPPRTRHPIDLRSDPRYASELDPDCDGLVRKPFAIDVSERPAKDFLWQRTPRDVYDIGDTRFTFPGVDYLVAYWLGRSLGHLEDDRPGVCARWREP